jgi:hypothetical protein
MTAQSGSRTVGRRGTAVRMAHLVASQPAILGDFSLDLILFISILAPDKALRIDRPGAASITIEIGPFADRSAPSSKRIRRSDETLGISP